MALGFFRKRQKLIFVIMVALMVSFLIGYQGLSMLLSKDPGKFVIGSTPDYEITVNMHKRARVDMELLRRLAGGFGSYSQQGAAFQMMQMGAAREEDVALAYCMLLADARKRGFSVANAEVDDLIQQMKANKFPYDRVAADLRQNQNLPEKDLRAVLSRWLTVFKAYRASIAITPPSREELLRLFRDVTEQMSLRVVKIPAESFLAKAAKPDEEQIRRQFEQYKNSPAGDFAGIKKFSFGYLVPPKVVLEYIYVNRQAIEQAALPTAEEVQDYYIEHQDEFLKNSKNPEISKKSSPTTLAAARGFAEAREEIIDKLRPQAARARFQETIDRIQQMLRSEGQAAKADAPVYAGIAAKLTRPADDLLGRKILIVSIREQPLDEAVRILARSASPSLAAICWPWGEHGKVNISPKLKVTLVGTNLTVAEALEKIAAQIPGKPKLRWGRCDGFDDVIFPTGRIRFFPVTAGRTALSSLEELRANPLLANSFIRVRRDRRMSLPTFAMQTKPINPAGMMEPGREGPVFAAMGGGYSGAVLWRVLGAQPSKSPEAITDTISKNAARDWKFAKAFELARKEAGKIGSAADLDKYAKAKKLEPIETGMFARKVPFAYGAGYFQPGLVGKMNFKDPVVDIYFIQQAFADLAPADLEKKYPKQSAGVMVVPLACEGCVAVAQRTDYVPAIKSDFERQKQSLMIYVERDQYTRATRNWFLLRNIEQRADFSRETK